MATVKDTRSITEYAALLASHLRDSVVVAASSVKRQFGTTLPTRVYSVRWMERVDASRSSGRRANRSELDMPLLWASIEGDMGSCSAFQALQATASEVAETCGRFPSYFGPALLPQQAEILLFEYFRRQDSFCVDQRRVVEICEDYTATLAAQDFSVRGVYRVQGFSAPEQFSLSPEIIFRPLGDADIDVYGRDWLDPNNTVPSAREWLHREDWACVIEARATKESNVDLIAFDDLIEEVVLALGLVASGRAEFSLLGKSESSPFFGLGITWGGSRSVTSRRGQSVTFSRDRIDSLRDTFSRIRLVATDSRLAFLALPLRRLRMASERTHDEDQLVDCVVALENLLASDTPQIETTFRFKLRGAALLPDSFGDIRARLAMMARLYDGRSKTVHGAKRAHGKAAGVNAANGAIRQLADDATDVLRAIVGWYLERTDQPGTLQNILTDLDVAMVQGARSWATKSSD